MSIDLIKSVESGKCYAVNAYLRLDQHQIYEQYHIIVLDIFITKSTTVLTDCQANSMPTGLVISAMILCIESFDWGTAFYADWHLMGR